MRSKGNYCKDEKKKLVLMCYSAYVTLRKTNAMMVEMSTGSLHDYVYNLNSVIMLAKIQGMFS